MSDIMLICLSSLSLSLSLRCAAAACTIWHCSDRQQHWCACVCARSLSLSFVCSELAKSLTHKLQHHWPRRRHKVSAHISSLPLHFYFFCVFHLTLCWSTAAFHLTSFITCSMRARALCYLFIFLCLSAVRPLHLLHSVLFSPAQMMELEQSNDDMCNNDPMKKVLIWIQNVSSIGTHSALENIAKPASERGWARNKKNV